ncbi:MAG TPA: hypothetical protein VFI55_06560 [Mycobacterium sp.]|nr:hypothetical protein [Mycobacterium sp.]
MTTTGFDLTAYKTAQQSDWTTTAQGWQQFEPALQRLDQRKNLVTQGAFGQIGEHLRATFPHDQCLKHGSRRYAGQVGGHRRWSIVSSPTGRWGAATSDD